MEEDIKNLSEIIELCEEEINNNDENVSAVLDLTDLLSLRRLIKTYKDLKEIEKNHKKENGELRERVKHLEEENERLKGKIDVCNWQEKSCRDIIDEKYIPVSLVKEKITEYKERKMNCNDKETEIISDIKIQAYEELLEKRK
ncbi:MAG: hypothetical protein ACI4UU_00645 [Clostridia bacterium]